MEDRHERNGDHGEANGALRGSVRQFRGFRDKSHHNQIRANDGDVLKPEPQEMRQGWYLVQRIYQLRRPPGAPISFPLVFTFIHPARASLEDIEFDASSLRLLLFFRSLASIHFKPARLVFQDSVATNAGLQPFDPAAA